MIRLICRASYSGNDRGGSVGPTTHPSRALPLVEMDLPGGSARAAEVGGQEFQTKLVSHDTMKGGIVYNA